MQCLNVWVKLGQVEILLRPGDAPPREPSYERAAAAIVLYTNDLLATAKQLRARGLKFEGCDGSDKCPTFRDPDGHWFQLVNPSDH